ncbi:hypothetical protein C7212DRAFT_281114 [Tuber magnatum]|uniref:Uncharacterized protein n=1 Tax=Tuber magnatum TaxID=42249 RepID=A0A317SXP1_9PEZI|nr:hypothetical protein C7212DRAFT_281114 [Tuber magnatum]
MREFTPKEVYPHQCVCPTGDEFVEWIRQEVHSFGGGSTYLDLDLFSVAKDILSGTAVERNVVALNAVIAWRAKKQNEIMDLVKQLVEREIIPESAAHSPIQLLPISKEAFENRQILTKLVPELLTRFEIPDTEDELQTKFNAPLYWFAIVLSRARRETPFMCELKKVVGVLVDLGIANVPSQWDKDEWISKMTADTELKGETLYLGEDEITKDLVKLKPFFGWRLPPYDVCEVPKDPEREPEPEAEAEAVVVVTKDLDGGEELEGSAVVGFAHVEDGKGGGEGGGARKRGMLRDIGLIIALIVLYVLFSGVGTRLAPWQGIERITRRVRYWTSPIEEEILTLAPSSG